MFTKWIAAAGLACAAALAPQAAKPAANDDLSFVCPEAGLALSSLIDQAREVTGETFFFDDREVKDVKLTFFGKMVVPRAKFMSFFDYCVRSVDFVPLESMEAGAKVHEGRRCGPGGPSFGSSRSHRAGDRRACG